MDTITVGEENRRLHEELAALQRQVANLNVLQDLAKALTAELDLQRLLRRIMSAAAEMATAEASSLLLVDEERQELVFWTIYQGGGDSLREQRMPRDQGIAGWVATHGQPLIVNDVQQDPRFARAFSQKITDTTGFRPRAILCVPLWTREKVIGVVEVLNKASGADFSAEDVDLLAALASYAATALENARLYQAVYTGYLDTMRALAATIDAKDPYTRGHSERVTTYAERTARQMGLPEKEMETLKYGAILHDIGKIAIDERILRKPRPLNVREKAIMDSHPVIGANIVDGIAFLKEAQPIIRSHHERYNGQGYPLGLKGGDISAGARILALADSFDAMTTLRPYRPPMSKEQALEEVQKYAGTQFDPLAAAAFVEQMEGEGRTAG